MGYRPGSISAAILRYLAYAQVFSYPPTGLEVWQRISLPASYAQVRIALLRLRQRRVVETDGYRWQLAGKNSLTRYSKVASQSKQKWQILASVSHVWPRIPGLSMVMVTGSLAANNATAHDDIDLCVVTEDHRLWTARMALGVILNQRGLLRRFHSSDDSSQDLLCANLWLSQSHMGLPRSRRSLYTAHEVIMALPIYDPSGTWLEFRRQNRWISTWLPNATIESLPSVSQSRSMSLVETAAYKLQRFYMRPHISTEVITPTRAFFHPRPTASLVLERYAQELSMIGLRPDESDSIGNGRL